jgi:hypothetical protein
MVNNFNSRFRKTSQITEVTFKITVQRFALERHLEVYVFCMLEKTEGKENQKFYFKGNRTRKQRRRSTAVKNIRRKQNKRAMTILSNTVHLCNTIFILEVELFSTSNVLYLDVYLKP